MGLVVVLAVLAFVALGFTMFVGTVRETGEKKAHRWVVALPLVVAFGWLIEELIVSH
jgi:uncharacterized YccA/Bax inhibitor family protein